MNEQPDNNGINIWKLPNHLQTCPKCYGSGDFNGSVLPNGKPMYGEDIDAIDDDYRKVAGTWNDQHPKCLDCSGAGYIERELDTQWESLGITPKQAVEDWDAALKENFGDNVLKQVQEIRRQQNEELT